MHAQIDMFSRYINDLLNTLLADFRIVYLTGPRQAGKTTLARRIAADRGMKYISLDDQTAFESAQSDPQGYIDSVARHGAVVLDEFQYVPELISAMKRASDQLKPNEKGRFFLTGSTDIFRSARTQEALPGHMARTELYPLSVTEIVNGRFNLIDFLLSAQYEIYSPLPSIHREDIAHTLLNGGYPELQGLSARSRPVWFDSYLQGRLFKDFESVYVAKGDYHTKLAALVPYLAGLSGSLLKYASVANDLQQNDKVVKSYIEALEWMFIVKRLHPYVKNRAKRQSIGMPKIHMVDTGLACHLLGLTTVEQLLTSMHYGGLLENFVLMECCKHLGWAQQDARLYHFRDKQKNEVDLVLESNDGRLIAVEIKASSTVKREDFKGIQKFAELAGASCQAGVIFYSGQEILPFQLPNHRGYALPFALLWS